MKKFFLIITLFLTSCESTKTLWSGEYKEPITEFLISNDGNYVSFSGPQYHYIFADDFNELKQLLNLDRYKIILIDEEKSYFLIDNEDNVKAYLVFKTYDSNLSPMQLAQLSALDFKQIKNGDLQAKIMFFGRRYEGPINPNFYRLLFRDAYEITIRNATVPVSADIKKIALTPFAMLKDFGSFLSEVLEMPFKE